MDGFRDNKIFGNQEPIDWGIQMSMIIKSSDKSDYVTPQLILKGDIATLTQGSKSWGSGDAWIFTVTDNSTITDIVDNVTHYS